MSFLPLSKVCMNVQSKDLKTIPNRTKQSSYWPIVQKDSQSSSTISNHSWFPLKENSSFLNGIWTANNYFLKSSVVYSKVLHILYPSPSMKSYAPVSKLFSSLLKDRNSFSLILFQCLSQIAIALKTFIQCYLIKVKINKWQLS